VAVDCHNFIYAAIPGDRGALALLNGATKFSILA
jgi:hypothetical protein